jgi:hypothetical protein
MEPALREQNLIDVRIARADLLGHVGNIKIDGSTAARFEVDERRAVTDAEEVARMRFAVQQLLGSTAAVRMPVCRYQSMSAWVPGKSRSGTTTP